MAKFASLDKVDSAFGIQIAEINANEPKETRKVAWFVQAQQRQQALTGLQSLCKQRNEENTETFSADSFCRLFSQDNVLHLLFRLFDHHSRGKLVHSDFIGDLKEKLRPKTDFIDLLDTLWYIFVKEDDIDFEIFCRIFKSKGVLGKLFALIDTDKAGAGQVSVNQVMAVITEYTSERRNLHILYPGRAEELFRSTVTNGNREMSFEDFKKLIPSKNKFFAERIFRIFNKDGSKNLSIAEFREGLEQFCGQSEEDKVRCLFQIYDENGDGLIKLCELKSVLKACIEENGMKFSEKQVEELAEALYDDARDRSDTSRHSTRNGLTYDELKAQMSKHPGLLENLSISLDRFLLPSPEKKTQRQPIFKPMVSYVKNNVPFVIFVLAYAIVNLGLFISRAIQYKDSNMFYILARSCGQTLNFNCAFILVLMLRRGITLLRNIGCGSFLPVDQHVYLHKVCGGVVVVLSALHILMHIINFPLNIAGELVSPVTNTSHSAAEWLFTMRPGLFGLYPGLANITGWALVVILAIMVICSLPSVRNSGYFEVFYWTHLLYIPFWILLILHGPNFWYWFIGTGLCFALFKASRRIKLSSSNRGCTDINSAMLLPSRVTHLVIRKPENFYFHPGDYVYLKVPAITSTEWHPFTISSAPELPDFIWLHIRCAGGWTNKLYEYFEQEQSKQLLRTNNVKNDNKKEPKAISAIEPTSVENDIRSKYKSHCIAMPSGMPMHQQPCTENVSLPIQIFKNSPLNPRKMKLTPRASHAPETVAKDSVEIIQSHQPPMREERHIFHSLEVAIDGPYGAPSSHIFRAEHAVLIAAGIGVTPFASILQSIMHRYYAIRQSCPNCNHSWASQMPDSIMNLKKVDFFWINRDQRSFEWFVDMLSQLEMEQTDVGGVLDRFLDLHMYITSALKKTDMKAVGLQMAFDLLYAKDKRDLVTGLKTRTNAGRPNWDKVFQKLVDEDKGKVTVFYCGPPQLAKELRKKCNEFGFDFRKEIF
ncbi:hypothetical protein DAPPUDRAFT_323294 [Daphnia pulex]|uniref:NADPH oxidase 5 n=1 Tax=Daphnia pulex TaxID=6669 RepID=E9GYH0_DAPPU|nr:hypothetical protein DAPPUDRAFT_323294 [Daphnia pulex]|eukprot:EFX75389.1 hypothetical protein DAPPUDRAFT_323294 [Daphnia pulex]